MTNRQLEDILRGYEGRQRDALLPVLWDVQTAFGHINAEAVHAISHALHVPEADIYGVISFYTMFYDQPTGKKIIRVCTDPSCGAQGADEVLHGLCHQLGLPVHGGTTDDGEYTVEHSPCLGLCEHAPAALISERGVGESSVAFAKDPAALLNGASLYDLKVGTDPGILLAGVNGNNAQSLSAYGDYQALHKALDTGPEAIIKVVKDSGLVGRGGAGFPTGLKWQFTRGAEGTHYVVCNADESEPGTFKDRVLMEARAHLILEGMAICGFTIGAEKGYIFIRGEYPNATARMQAAIDEAEAAGLLGDNIMGTDFSFHVEIRRGAGAYICGEESALFEAIEGKRGFPRIKPPYPTTHGLFMQPTAINNVETLSLIPSIIEHGAAWFRQYGTEKTAGPKLVAVSGHVNRPGVYEIAPGLTLRELLENHCEGIIGELQAVLVGGAAGTFLAPDEIDVRLSIEDLRAIGGTLGSGATMVFNTTVTMQDILRRLARFFKHESCGKCYPCQLGTQRQMEILERHTPLLGDRKRLADIGMTMTEASLCGLGQTAAMAVLSALDKWPTLMEVK